MLQCFKRSLNKHISEMCLKLQELSQRCYFAAGETGHSCKGCQGSTWRWKSAIPPLAPSPKQAPVRGEVLELTAPSQPDLRKIKRRRIATLHEHSESFVGSIRFKLMFSYFADKIAFPAFLFWVFVLQQLHLSHFSTEHASSLHSRDPRKRKTVHGKNYRTLPHPQNLSSKDLIACKRCLMHTGIFLHLPSQL